MQKNTAYYAIIPAEVRYDPDLPPNAKLLYGEITALSHETGYCWASNRYFAELYGASIRSVKNWIGALSEKGYIQIKLIYREGSKEVESRFITITGSEKNFTTPGKKFHEGSEKNFTTPGEKNFPDNNTSINNTSIKGDAKFQKNLANLSPKYIIRLFNEICLSLEPAKYLTNNRLKAVESIMYKYSSDQIKECFRLAESSRFLTGANKRKWKATFDWLIQDENIAKVLEGNFNNNDHLPKNEFSFDLDEFFEAAVYRGQESFGTETEREDSG